jgi:ElaB/YqjD/DUF883 family membrane-anchored ribosome-binding protein
METRQPGEHGDTGLGEVHAHISQPDKGRGTSGGYTSGPGGAGNDLEAQASEAKDRATAMLDDAREQAADVAGRVKHRAEELRDSAQEAVGDARERASKAVDRAERELEERTGIVTMIRDNPLPALGIALAAGYLLAGSRRDKRGRLMNMATGQLRGAIMGGLSAALMNELRDIVAQQGGTLASLLGENDRGESTSGARTNPETGGYGYDRSY